MKPSEIGWTDFSGGFFNFCTGCTQISPGCANCYAKAIYDRFGRDFTPAVHLDKLGRLVSWSNRLQNSSPKRGVGYKPMVFVCDTSDMFHNDFMTGDNRALMAQALLTMYRGFTTVWQILTKRPQNAESLFREYYTHIERIYPSGHVWLGVSAENQKAADERIPILLSIPNVRHFVSIEPMLGPIDISQYLPVDGRRSSRLEWVIVGGESGPKHRPMEEEWGQEIAHRCLLSQVPFFYKQDSARYPGTIAPEPWKVQEWPD